ncbi:MAG: DUF6884 domain-containing protein [Pyrobaculum sp.]
MISVVTNCTAKKLDRPAPARELYLGPSVRRTAKAVDEARKMGVEAALYIISAKHGLLREDQVVEPYDQTLSGKPKEEVKKWAREVGLIDAFEKLARETTVVLTVTKPYYWAVEEAACKYDIYVLAPYKACGKWIKTGHFDKHKVLKELLKSALPPSSQIAEGATRRNITHE